MADKAIKLPPSVPPASGPRFDALKSMLSNRNMVGKGHPHPMMSAVSKQKHKQPTSTKKK